MSQYAPSSGGSGESAALGPGLETLRAPAEFRGPVEPLGDHGHAHDNDHFALVYESREEQLQAAIPFIRQGLELDEQCVYIAHENSREEIAAAMRAEGIDVDAALESGALSVLTPEESYFSTGEFDPEAVLSFWEDSLEAATVEDDYTGVRAAAEMSWALEDGIDYDVLIEYEEVLNSLYEGEDYVVLCQYNRTRFPSDVVRDVINTHPLLVHDGRISHNVYYTPPEEFFGPERTDREVDRLLGMLREQTDAKAELQHRERLLRESYRITSDPDLGFEEKLVRLLELGRERFDIELGGMAAVDPAADRLEIEHVSAETGDLASGIEPSLSETYCGEAYGADEAVAITDPVAEGYDDCHAYRDLGLEAYLGTHVEVEGGRDRVFFFATTEPREAGFSAAERTFVDLLGQWLRHDLERQHRERFLRESYRITSDPDLEFEEKLERLLELGREWLGLDAAGLTHLPAWDDRFRNEYTVGYGDDEDGELWTDPEEGHYCREVIAADEPVGMADVRGTDWEDDEIHREYGLTCYLGTKVTNGSTPYGSLWVGSTEPRAREFTETERTFFELMGEWVSYEIEREHRERALGESNERLEQFAYAASHDLQEPLRMVTSYLQLLERRYGDAFDEDGEEFLAFAVDGAERMREMIDGLLEYSRVETCGDPIEPVELETVLDDVLEDLQFHVEETGADISSGDLPRVEGDGNQLRQVFQNLLENAITYRGDSAPDVRVDAERRKREWVISVRDDGIGIDPEEQERIFDVFDRLHSRDEYEGTGLGLALCQRIVERHDGELWVESEPGEGSTFSFTLPEPR